MAEHFKPIFFDHTGKRWGRLRRWGFGAALAFSILGALISFSILVLPATPLSLGIPVYKHVRILLPDFVGREQAAREFLAGKTRAKLMKQIQVEQTSRRKLNPGAKPYSTVVGFYVNWEPASYASLRAHADALTYIMPEWLALPADGMETPDGKCFANRFDTTTYDPQVVKLARDHGLPIIPMLDNADKGSFHWDRLKALLSDSDAQKKLASALRDYLVANHFAGINIDFEPTYDPSTMTKAQIADARQLMHDELPSFLQILKGAFKPKGLLVTQDVPPKDDTDFDYSTLSEVNDFVVVMLYDQHFTGGNPGPIAAQNWIEQMADSIFSKMDSSKVVLGLGNYCYDWPVKIDKHGNVVESLDGEIAFNGPGQKAELGSALRVASESGADLFMDEGDLNPYFTYAYSDNQAHIVYMLDAVTMYNEILALKGYEPRGAALWYLGSEDPAIWSFFDESKLSGRLDTSKLQTVSYSAVVNEDLRGQGEIMDILANPKTGRRKFTTDGDGLITAERYTQYPAPFIIGRFGNAKKKLALTFDDGPDPTYTPKIMRILKQNGVPGTFFVIGQNVENHPELVRTSWQAGNEIGNHTFTHPHISEVSRLHAELEMNATQRLIESLTGHSTRLFRPPFGEGADTNPGAKDIALLQEAQNFGYLTVGMNIDPKDYEAASSDAIVNSVERQISLGNVILLHDGGGDRSKTVEALPKIIRELKAQGYQFVTISGLLGDGAHNRIFPLATHSQEALAGLDRAAFETSFVSNELLKIVFLISIILGVFRVLLVTPLALMQARRARRSPLPGHAPPVTVIIPAYNEGKVICRTISGVLDSDYPDLKVIVVDDGSTDDTPEVVQKQFADNPRVTFIRKENGGKSSALNLGIAKADAEIIVCLDADTIFAKDTIALLAQHFADPSVGAVAGNVKVGNRTNPLTMWQSLEYITSQNYDRRAYAALNSVSVVPGAVGAWRKSAVLDAGGYGSDTLAEDTDLTYRIRLLGYHIHTENLAYAYTEAPDTVQALAKQRFRWAFGTLQSLWKHRRAMFNRRHGWFGIFVMPATWVYSILFQAISPIVDVMIVLSIFNQGFAPVLIYYAAFFALDFVGSSIAIKLDGEDERQLMWLFWQRFFYRQFMCFIILKSLFAALRGGIVGWGKLHRKATVTAPTA